MRAIVDFVAGAGNAEALRRAARFFIDAAEIDCGWPPPVADQTMYLCGSGEPVAEGAVG